jgi:hypothetical protein
LELGARRVIFIHSLVFFSESIKRQREHDAMAA